MSGLGSFAAVVLTRPQDSNGPLAGLLRAQGLRVLQAPALTISPMPVAVTAGKTPSHYDLVVFVSGNAVRHYLRALGTPVWPAQTMAAAVGAGTAQALRDSGLLPAGLIIHPDPMHGAQDSESLWPLLEARLGGVRRALIVRGTSGREWLGQQLEEKGIVVDRLAVYRRDPAIWGQDEQHALESMFASGGPCIFLLTSAEGVDAVHANMRRLGLEREWARARFVVIHARIAARLQSVLAASGKVEPPVVKICQPGTRRRCGPSLRWHRFQQAPRITIAP